MILTIRPLVAWPGELLAPARRRSSPFQASYSDTLELLDRELRMLRAAVTVVQIAVNEGQVRKDGKLRVSAVPDHPGVVLSFDTKAGHFRYACDRFTHWHTNLRAIALALEALRKIERYGIGSGTEQYTGFLQLDSAPEPDRPMTVAEAQAFLDEHGGYRTAALKLHPDRPGGDHRMFQRLQEAIRVLKNAS